jgi:phage gp45-like
MGTVVLNGANPGTATVSNSLVTANSLIFLTKQTNVHSGNGTVSVTSKGSGTFSITSDHNGDTDTVAYQIINPA